MDQNLIIQLFHQHTTDPGGLDIRQFQAYFHSRFGFLLRIAFLYSFDKILHSIVGMSGGLGYSGEN